MTGLKIAAGVLWVAFIAYWAITAVSAKAGTRTGFHAGVRLAIAALVIVIVRVVRPGSLQIHSLVVAGVGVAVEAAGFAVAVWARVHLGRNWGMPMTVKQDPELVTTGPYAVVRNPIYSGLLLALIGTALAINLTVLVAVVAVGAYFVVSARVEDRNLAQLFPDTYPAYRDRTKMLIPHVL
jgi:protein-S-isoprenylcysteine O-methyltransferase Ste14